jgi:hypothetical protein
MLTITSGLRESESDPRLKEQTMTSGGEPDAIIVDSEPDS